MKVENDDGYVQKRQNYILTIIYQNVLFKYTALLLKHVLLRKENLWKKVTQKKSKTKASREKNVTVLDLAFSWRFCFLKIALWKCNTSSRNND